MPEAGDESATGVSGDEVSQVQPSLFSRRADQDAAARYFKPVLAYLTQAKGWRLRREICAEFPELTDRVVREIAANSQGQILSGQSGYILITYATKAEMDHAEGWLRSQAREMLKRVIAIRKARNRNQGGVAAA